MSYTRFITPEPIGDFNGKHTTKEINEWLDSQKTAQIELPLQMDATAPLASTTDSTTPSTLPDANTTQTSNVPA